MTLHGVLRLVGGALALSAIAWVSLVGVAADRMSQVLVLGTTGTVLVALGEVLEARSRR